MHPAPSKCPVCGGELHIREVACAQCGSQIRGQFTLATCRYCRLAPEQQRFLETFLRCRGVYTCVERELNISYPTVKARLEALLQALGLAPHEEEKLSANERTALRTAILDALERGELTPEQAAEELRRLR